MGTRARMRPFLALGLPLAALGRYAWHRAFSRSQEPIRVKVNLVSVAFVARDASAALWSTISQKTMWMSSKMRSRRR